METHQKTHSKPTPLLAGLLSAADLTKRDAMGCSCLHRAAATGVPEAGATVWCVNGAFETGMERVGQKEKNRRVFLF